MLVDVHAHLTHKEYKGKLDIVIKRAEKEGVVTIICSGVNSSTNKEVLELSKKYRIVKASAGIYPLDAIGYKEPEGAGLTQDKEPIDLEKEFKFIKANDFIAIGEAGLDMQYVTDKLKEQQEIFAKVIEFSKKIKKPLVVHTRKAEKECIDMLEASGIKKVNLHCFTGSMKLVKRAEDLGYRFSIPSICVRLKHFQEVIQRVDVSHLLTETDCPYLTPETGRVSEPKDVIESVKMISKLKQLDLGETKKIIYSNYQKLFLL